MKTPTALSHAGRPKVGQRTVATPIEQGSTVLFKDAETFVGRKAEFFYGRAGTSTHRAFEDSLLALEPAAGIELTPSGLNAVILAILAHVGQGDHLLVTDSAYDPTRNFCDSYLKQLDVETTYFDPRIADSIGALIRPNTQLILCESPGSLTFEIQNIPAIVSAANDVPVAVDNTWATGALFRPLDHGAAVSIQAITKYVGGHSDLLMGAVASRQPETAAKVAKTARLLGISVSAQDVSLAHRGLRTLTHRLAAHEKAGLALADWLAQRPEVKYVLHPGREDHPDHELWARDFNGSSGLFSVVMNWSDEQQTVKFLNALKLFGLGYSWGGFESLCMPAWPSRYRTAVPWTEAGQLFRFHVGLEDIGDLIADLSHSFDQL